MQIRWTVLCLNNADPVRSTELRSSGFEAGAFIVLSHVHVCMFACIAVCACEFSCEGGGLTLMGASN